MDNIILIGAGGHAKVVYEAAILSGHKICGYIDEKPENFYDLKRVNEPLNNQIIISFGGITPKQLKRRQEVFESYPNQKARVIHPNAIISPKAKIEEGTFVNAGAIINAGAKIGKNCIINSGAIIEHDAVIEDGCHIAPSAKILGEAHIGKFCMIGAGAVIVQNCKIKSEIFIKANSVMK